MKNLRNFSALKRTCMFLLGWIGYERDHKRKKRVRNTYKRKSGNVEKKLHSEIIYVKFRSLEMVALRWGTSSNFLRWDDRAFFGDAVVTTPTVRKAAGREAGPWCGRSSARRGSHVDISSVRLPDEDWPKTTGNKLSYFVAKFQG